MSQVFCFPPTLGQLPGLVIPVSLEKWIVWGSVANGGEGRGARWFKKVSGILGRGFVNTEKEEVVWFVFSRYNKY